MHSCIAPVMGLPAGAKCLSRRSAMASLAAVLLLPAQASPHAPLALHEQRQLFGSPAEILVSAEHGEPAAMVLAQVFAGLQRINDRWNAWKPGEVSTLNQAFRSGTSATATPALLAMLRAAAQLEQSSAGLFNAGVGGAVQAWGFHDDEMRPGPRPSASIVSQWRAALPSLSQLEMRGNQVRSHNPALQLDFGAYAKGVAIDLALDQFQASGVANAVVNLGGNLAAMGQAGARAWRIGIRDPAGPGLMASLMTQGREAVVTSGSYERFRVLDGQRCTHILDPFTAAPATELVSVTVLHRSAALADAAATALLVAGPQRWRRVAERMGVRDVLVVDRHLRGEVSPRLAQRLQFASAAWRANIAVL
jgi:FAD:protein FMN transferase